MALAASSAAGDAGKPVCISVMYADVAREEASSRLSAFAWGASIGVALVAELIGFSLEAARSVCFS